MKKTLSSIGLTILLFIFNIRCVFADVVAYDETAVKSIHLSLIILTFILVILIIAIAVLIVLLINKKFKNKKDSDRR